MKVQHIALTILAFFFIGFALNAQTTASNETADLSKPNFVEMYDNEMVKQTGFIIKNKNEGNWIQYNQNGNIEIEGNYASGKKTGEWKYYDDDGMLKGKVLWVRDRALYKEVIEAGSVATGAK